MSQRGPEENPGTDPSVSFHQRLRERYGETASRLDPGIHLEEPSGGASSDAPPKDPAKGPGGDSAESHDPTFDSGSTRALFHKLNTSTSVSVRYRMGDEVGRGGMGTVLRVWDQDLRRTLAMKVLTSTPSPQGPIAEKDEERLSRFLEEAQITGQLDHPGIVPVHDMGIGSDGRLYFTMRLVRGRELKEVLDLAREGREGWTQTRAIGLILKVCEAMAFAHSKGVVHRDLKPSNVMVGRFGEVYVMDWGLARVLGRKEEFTRPRATEDPSSMSIVRTVRRDESTVDPESPLITLDGDVVGTPSYMAPEQAQGKLEELGARSDVFSLGGILYFMLTGRSPYVEPGERISPHVVLQRVLDGPPAPVSKFVKDASAELVAICEKAMAPNARERYQSMLEVADDLQAYLENRVVRAYEGGAWAEFRKWTRRNRGMALAIAGIFLLVLASIIGFAIQKDGQVQRIAQQQAITEAARHESDIHARRATANEQEANRNLELAREKKEEADRSAAAAAASLAESRRSNYAASVSAANYCIALDEAGEARGYLERAEPELRGWEWEHLTLRADAARLAVELSRDIIREVGVAEDGTAAFIVTRGGRMLSFDVETGEELGRTITDLPSVLGPNTDSGVTAFSPASPELAVVRAGSLKLSRPGGNVPIAVEGQVSTLLAERRCTALAYAPNGRSLAIGLEDGGVAVLDLVHGNLRVLPPEGARIATLAWSPDATGILAVLQGGGVRRADLADLASTPIELPDGARPTTIAWTEDGQRFLTGDESGTVDLWELDGTLVRTLERHKAPVTSIDTHSGQIASASSDGVVRLHVLAGHRSVILRGHEEAVARVCFLPEGRRLISGDVSGWLRVWDTEGDGSSTSFATDVDTPSDGVLLPDGRSVIVCGDDAFLGQYEVESGRRVRIFRGHDEGSNVTAVAVSADGRRLLSGGSDKTARLWDVATGDQLAIFRGHIKWISAVALSADGSRAYTGSSDKSVRVWNCRTGELLRTLEGHERSIYALALSPDGKRLVSSSNEIIVWDPELGVEVGRFDGHGRSRTITMSFSPDGKRLVSGSSGREFALWSMDTAAAGGAALARFEDHGDKVRSVSFHPHGTRLVSVGRGGEILLRDAETGILLLRLDAEGLEILHAEFHSDGNTLTAVASDGTRGVVASWYTNDKVARFARLSTAREERRREEQILEETLLTCDRVEDLPRKLQEREDLEPEFRTRALALAEWMSGMPWYADEIHRARLASGDYDEGGLARMLTQIANSMERWPHSPALTLTYGAALLRSGDALGAESVLVEVLRLNDSPEARLAWPRLSPRALQVRRLLLVLALEGQGRLESAAELWRQLDRELQADASFETTGPLADLRDEVATRIAPLLGV